VGQDFKLEAGFDGFLEGQGLGLAQAAAGADSGGVNNQKASNTQPSDTRVISRVPLLKRRRFPMRWVLFRFFAEA